mmetsp:Transcript_38806/g.76940  ORF Transcript_38806/g.76940 Transcript_38806/m.76940 type:complete len:369 (-) Transcript_38806:40-1146(-)
MASVAYFKIVWLMFSASAATEPNTTEQNADCYEHSKKVYALNWKAQGTSFFDDGNWEFTDYDGDPGHPSSAARYNTRADAFAHGLVEAHATHAIVRVGGKSADPSKRNSVKLQTQGKHQWKYFLAAMRFSHTPYGCGVWPAFWILSRDRGWPAAGEFDILESCNDIPMFTSFHTASSGNPCRLNPAVINKAGCPQMTDYNGNGYSCITDYRSGKKGCAPNVGPLRTPEQWAKAPGVLAVEWTERYLKTFFIPDEKLQTTGLLDDAPTPDSWDQFVTSYYPFAASQESIPGSCPNPQNVIGNAFLILNIELCGSWAGSAWRTSCGAPSCQDFMSNTGNDAYVHDHAFFNVSWVKVFQQRKTTAKVSVVV